MAAAEPTKAESAEIFFNEIRMLVDAIENRSRITDKEQLKMLCLQVEVVLEDLYNMMYDVSTDNSKAHI